MYADFFQSKLDDLKAEGRYRHFATLARQPGNFPYATLHKNDGTEQNVTIWCSNDYLGMGQNPVVLSAMKDAVERYGAGAGGTRNISGTHKLHRDLETSLADLHYKEAALVFSSGYVANEGALSTLIKLLPDCAVFSDQLNHASMIHGMRSGRGAIHVFRHNDLAHLEELLQSVEIDRPKKSSRSRVSIPWKVISPLSPLFAHWQKNITPSPISTKYMRSACMVHAAAVSPSVMAC